MSSPHSRYFQGVAIHDASDEGFLRGHRSRGSPGSTTTGMGDRPALCRQAPYRRPLLPTARCHVLAAMG